MADEADAIVVGSGINGMVAAAELAQAGWSVILLERNDRRIHRHRGAYAARLPS
jgi:phytoene dehydrogenase-like protein